MNGKKQPASPAEPAKSVGPAGPAKSPKPAKSAKPAKRTVLQRVTLALYIVAVALSLVVVVAFVALKLFAPPPEVPSQMEFPLSTDSPPKQSDGAVNTAGPADSAEPVNTPDLTEIGKSETVTLNRRKGVYTCLLLGVADKGGSDTIMLGVFDTERKTASLLSIPRDTVVRYKDRNIKISASYSYGGVDAVRQCVSELLAVPVDYYVAVGTRAFREIVDEIDGVWFNVPVDMDYDDGPGNLHIHIKKGYQLLNGEQAEGVVRFRHGYASQDIARTATQRAFLTALVKQTVTLSNVTKVTNLINILNTYVKSDMSLSNMVYFGTQAVGMDLDTALTSSILSTHWVSPYIVPSEEEVLKVVNSLGIYEEEVPTSVLRLAHP